MLRNPITWTIVFFLVLIMVLVALFFSGHTADGPYQHETWAAFGTYVGGVVTPMTVLAALLALALSDRARRAEMGKLIAQGHRADLLRFIEKIEADIASAINSVNITVKVPTTSVTHPGADVLFRFSMMEWKDVIPREADIRSRVDQSSEGLERYDTQLMGYEVFSAIAAYLNRLRDHCEAYDRSAGNNATSLYFARKYRLATQRLNAKGYPIKEWKPTEQDE